MKKLLVLLLFAFVFLRISPLSYADGSTGNVTVSKTVLNPKTNTYVKNLNISDAVYHPGDTVAFHITLSNTGGQNIEQIIVKDTLPQYVTFVSGVGSYDQKNKILSFLAYNLKPNTTQSFAVTTKVVSSDQFPSNQRNVCVANKASITFGQNQTTQDTAQLCITVSGQTAQPTSQVTNQPTAQPTSTNEQSTTPQQTKGGQPIYPPVNTTTTPSTGPESILFPILLALGAAGLFLIKRTTRFITLKI